MLERIFNNEPCCLLNSFKESELLKVAKETLDPGHNNNNRDKPLPNEVRKFLNIYRTQKTSPQARALWSVLCRQDIEEVQQRLFAWLENICDADVRMKKQDIIAAADKLREMKNMEDVLPSCFNKRNIEGFTKNLKNNGDRETFNKVRLLSILFFVSLHLSFQHEILRILMEFIKPNSEYDVFLLHKVGKM